MKVGFDLAQSSGSPTGCGWYAQALFESMARVAPEHHFLGYRHFAGWFNETNSKHKWPVLDNITDPLENFSMNEAISAWQQGSAPGNPQIVHSTSFQAPSLKGSKLIFTLFDLSFWALPDFTTDRIRSDCQKGVLDALQNAHGIIFISEHAQKEFERFVPNYLRKNEVQSVVIPLASRWTSKTQPYKSGDYWLFVGSLEPRKNLETLLTGYLLYRENHPDPKPLWIAGGAGWKNEGIASRLLPLERSGAVRRLGYVSEENLQTLYRRAHALLFPSWYEGFGLPVLEAMTQDCPVICSNRTSLPEVGGDAVHYIDPAEPSQMSLAMLRLERDPRYRQTLIESGQAQAVRFSWEQTAKQTLAFYERILFAPPLCS